MKLGEWLTYIVCIVVRQKFPRGMHYMNITSFLRTSAEPTVNPIARVDKTITGCEPGRVYFQGTYWPAKLKQPNYISRLCPGTKVRVLGRESLTLLIIPVQNIAAHNCLQYSQFHCYLPATSPAVSVN